MAQPHRPAAFDISTTPPVVEGQVVWARTETHEFVFPNNLCEQKEEEWTEMRAIRDEGLSAHADSNERRLFNDATTSAFGPQALGQLCSEHHAKEEPTIDGGSDWSSGLL